MKFNEANISYVATATLILFMMFGKPIKESLLPNLKKYKYSSVDLSLLSKYILQPYWSRLVLFLPLWLAPNLVTLIGFAVICLNISTLLYFVSDISDPLPSWVYFSFAAGLFIYQSLDAIDGKQARRTGTSSPLGEIFDHGCDALNASLGFLIACSSLSFGKTWIAVFTFLTGKHFFNLALGNFYLSTWEEYHTGTLYLGLINGPVDGCIYMMIVYIITGFYGPELWNQNISTVFGLTKNFVPFDLKLNVVFVITCSCLISFVLVTSLLNVYKECKRKKTSAFVAFLGILPFALFSFLIIFWLSNSSVVFQKHFIPFILASGVSFGNIVGKMIVAHVVFDDFPYFNINYIFLAIGGLLSSTPHEVGFLYFYLAITTIHHLSFCLGLINQICNFLDINCLTIKKKAKQ